MALSYASYSSTSSNWAKSTPVIVLTPVNVSLGWMTAPVPKSACQAGHPPREFGNATPAARSRIYAPSAQVAVPSTVSSADRSTPHLSAADEMSHGMSAAPRPGSLKRTTHHARPIRPRQASACAQAVL